MNKIDIYNDGTGTGGTGIDSEIIILESSTKQYIHNVLNGE